MHICHASAPRSDTFTRGVPDSHAETSAFQVWHASCRRSAVFLRVGAMDFRIDARLGYRVASETPFVFNIEAQRFPGQTIVQETLSIEPGLTVCRWTMPESGNRYFRPIAPPGEFKVAYAATVQLGHPVEDPDQVHEIPPGELPLSVLTHLYPSR